MNIGRNKGSKKIFIVYRITNKINGRYYIGKTNLFRWTEGTYRGSGNAIKNAVKKYGVDAFTREIVLKTMNEEEAYEWEADMIDLDCPLIYNISPGGSGWHSGEYHPLWGKERQPFTETHRERLSKSHMGEKNAMYGVKLTGEKNHSFGKKYYHNPETGKTTRLGADDIIPEGFVLGRKLQNCHTLK